MSHASTVREGAAGPPDEPPTRRAGGWDRAHGWLLVAIDVAAIAVAVIVTISLGMESLREPLRVGGDIVTDRALIDLLLVLGWPLVLAATKAYDRRILGLGSEEYRVVVHSAIRIVAMAALAEFVLDLSLRAGYVLTVVGLGMVFSLISRRVARKRLHRRRSQGYDTRRVLAVGSAVAVSELAEGLNRIKFSGLRVVGAVVPGGATEVLTVDGAVPVVGTTDDLLAAMDAVRADAVAVADSSTLGGAGVRRLAWALEGRNVDLLVVPTVTDVVGPRVAIRPVGPIPLLFVDEPELAGPSRVAKAMFDKVASGGALLLLAPFLLALMIAVRVTSHGPALFRQERVGLDGRRFQMVKLRTMVAGAHEQHETLSQEAGDPLLLKLADDPRTTPLGRWLRRWSIDELPQLWNVLKGDMSLVGPRPGLAAEVARYEADATRRLIVHPGITGLWQVSGRGDLSWEETVRLDLYYVDNWSLALDVQILFRTVAAVVRHQGAY